jgi:ArsR family transcriptional regulator, arsenate/arsenite/antimonite-responsive transcriptional repressor
MVQMDQTAALAALSALAHEHRLAVFRLLVKAGEAGVAAGEIALAINVPASTLSANLAILTRAGLLRCRREGRSIIYLADYGQMRELLTFLINDCCAGEPAICEPLIDMAALPCP